jgi:alkylation response protein AidB-like acyl-CoA dehydrogenase
MADGMLVNTTDLVARAREVAADISASVDDIEAQRQLPDRLVARLHEARLYRALLPRSIGGEESDPLTFIAAIEILAAADASAAWCVAQGCGCSLAAGYLPPETARAVFAAADAVLAWGPSSKNAIAQVVEGGYMVRGTWHFASGSRHAQWLGAHGAVIERDGTPRLLDGRPMERTMLIPISAARMVDRWQVLGLRGTGSDDYIIDEPLFVPAAFAFTRDLVSDRQETGPLYRLSGFSVYAMAFAAIALGIARAMLDAFNELARDKVATAGVLPLRDSATVQANYALAEGALRSGRAFLRETVAEVWQTLSAGETLSLPQRGTLRLATTYACHRAREAADFAYHAAGSNAIFADGAFERRFRDLHTTSQQIQAHASNFELAGQVLLGLPPASKTV